MIFELDEDDTLIPRCNPTHHLLRHLNEHDDSENNIKVNHDSEVSERVRLASSLLTDSLGAFFDASCSADDPILSNCL